MRTYTFEELENMDVVELNMLCREYGMSTLSFRTFTLRQKIAFVHAHQILAKYH